MSKYSSFKEQQLLTESWKRYLSEGPNFHPTTGAPLTDKGKELCAKNPECREQYLSGAGAGPDEEREHFEASRRLGKKWMELKNELKELSNSSDQSIATLATTASSSEDLQNFHLLLLKVIKMLQGQQINEVEDEPESEDEEKAVTKAQYRQGTYQREKAKEMTGSGVTKNELQVVAALQQQIAAAAKNTNIIAGPIAIMMDKLSTAIQKALQNKGEEEKP